MPGIVASYLARDGLDFLPHEARVSKRLMTEAELESVMRRKTQYFEIESDGMFWLVNADIPFSV